MSQYRLPSLFDLPPQNVSILDLAPIQYQSQPIYKCNLCPKEFNRKSSLSRHFRKHTGERRFNCGICRKNFSRKDILNKHRMSRKCIVRSQNYSIMSVYENNIKDTQFSTPISSPISSSSNTDERMSISWLLANDEDCSYISSDVDDYQTSSSPY